ncbi:Protein kinase-like (PK-like) [Venturia nashicola]|uniref:Protein kinase-like (PK-like) n=1 Tax=Venturia nashicola TaxID=86259 RepID=A0A4Z1NQA4_9PEZI|nr:Protein kinase-like (PK-like) [Venturia nashicola]
MDADDVNQIHKATLHTWHLRLSNYNVNGIEKLASKYRNGDECECVKMSNGSFNWCFKVVFGDGTAWALRFPAAGNVMHREEKVRREVAVMKFLKERTSVPVPQVIAFGMSADNHDPEIGPFLITEWIEGILLSSIMEKLPRPEWGPVLRQDISEQTLYSIYRQIARILLELSMHSFDQIGALSMSEAADGTHSWPVQSAPMTLKMNEIERSGNVKVGDYSKKPFRTVTEYISSLVQQNITHLCDQRNSIDDADDARQKYILRQRVSCIAPSFVSDKHDSGPFKLICDDFRPGNILVKEDTLEILAVIDLEWTYAGPYQFLFSPPNWLILEEPTSWTTSSEARYQAKFQVFLQALEDEEAQMEIKRGTQDLPEEKMSVLMRQSMEDGKFWFNELIRQSFNFDEEVLWPHIEHHLTKIGLAEVGIPDPSEVEAFVRKSCWI